MPTQSQPNAPTSNTDDHRVLTGEIGMAIVWVAFYAIAILAPLAAKLAPVSTVVAFLAK